MIWEVDERLDEVIDLEEFQLTYYRNINDSSGNEPNNFFRLMEVSYLNLLPQIRERNLWLMMFIIEQFMIFDAANKGYIIEDDCMEILYGRYGGWALD